MQELQLVPEELLQKSSKILFLTHLALGDFVYMQNYFKAFSQKYPHIKIDLWVDEQRGKSFRSLFKGKKSRYILYDWLESCSFINRVHKDTNSRGQFKGFLKEIKNKNYSIVVSLGILRVHNFAKLARIISPKGFTVGFFRDFSKLNLIKRYNLKKLNKFVIFDDLKDKKDDHITHTYAKLFEKLFGLKVLKDHRKPFINFPKKWSYFGKLRFLKWGINKKDREGQKTIFINSFAKTKKRCWTMEKVLKLISDLRLQDEFYDARFIINVMPYQYENFKDSLKNFSSKRIFLFTVDFNFFQLPSILSLCDLVISVETSIIHLAAALRVPVIALMRQKNPEWVPFGTQYLVVSTKKRRDWVKNIPVQEVVRVTCS